MAKTRKTFDVWLVSQNTVFRAVPYNVVTDWIQQGRVTFDDQLRPTGGKDWKPLEELPDLAVFVPGEDNEQHVGDVAEALVPVEFEFEWKRRPEDEEEDVDMIPLIDISLVLLVFFMMTATVSAFSRVAVPKAVNTPQVDENQKAIWIGIDKGENGPVYSISQGTKAPPPEDDKLSSEAELFDRFDRRVREMSSAVEVRIAAHSDIMCEVVERVTTEVEKRRNQGINIESIRGEVEEKREKQ